MADIRINALATTATTPASDDYLALDGTAQGTRKILATNIANNVTDVILGTSGPSVKSSLSARAPRQGLVFDGTAGATATLASAVGTSAASFSFIYTVPTSNPASAAGVFGIGSSAAFTVAGSFSVILATNGDLEFYLFGTPNTTSMNAVVSGFRSAYSGKSVQVTATRDGSTFAVLINGVSTSFTLVTSTGSWADTISGTSVMIGDFSNIAATTGVISQPLIYNRALSASEVVSLYEAGAPAGADYNSASNTALNTNTVTTSGSGSISGASATGFAATATAGYFVRSSPGIAMKVGGRYRITFTASALTGTWNCYFSNGAAVGSATPVITSGVNTFELTSLNTNTNWTEFGCGGAGTLTVSGFSMVAVGLLLAPDAAQAGGGLVWYDTSGNAANISWTSGVSWNVPSSSKVATGWQFGGNVGIGVAPSARLHVLSTTSGEGPFATSFQYSNASTIISSGDGGANDTFVRVIGGKYAEANTTNLDLIHVGKDNNRDQGWRIRSGCGVGSTTNNGYLSFLQLSTSGSAITELLEAARFSTDGNLLIGTPADNGAKFQVEGYATFNRNGADGYLSVSRTSGATGTFGAGSTNSYLGTATNHPLVLYTNNTTALTLDSSQNATFAGSVRPEAAPSSKWAIDFASGTGSGAYVTIANDGTYDVAVGSGMLFVWDDGGSGVSQIMCYYGQTAITWQDGTFYTVTADTANKVNVYYNAGTNKYRVQNKSGSSKNFYISTIRLRQGS